MMGTGRLNGLDTMGVMTVPQLGIRMSTAVFVVAVGYGCDDAISDKDQ